MIAIAVSVSSIAVSVAASLQAAHSMTRLVALYTDPGSGALIVQLLITSGLMAAFYFSRARTWVAKRLGFGTNNAPSSQKAPVSGDPPNDAAAPEDL